MLEMRFLVLAYCANVFYLIKRLKSIDIYSTKFTKYVDV